MACFRRRIALSLLVDKTILPATGMSEVSAVVVFLALMFCRSVDWRV